MVQYRYFIVSKKTGQLHKSFSKKRNAQKYFKTDPKRRKKFKMIKFKFYGRKQYFRKD